MTEPVRARRPRTGAVAVALALLATVVGATMAAAADARVIVRGPSTHPTVALTIDDGYHPGSCEEIYDTLVELGVPATWLPNAVHVRKSPALWRKIAQRFEIANHTTHHLSLPSLSKRRIREEIASDERIVESVTGREMAKILRPPFGAYDRKVEREAGRLGYEVIALWDVTAADTAKDPPDRKVATNMLRGKAGSVILLHCGPPVTPRVLPIVIARYACRGFRFATLGDLLAGGQGTEAKVSCPPPRLPRDERRKPRPPVAEELLANRWRLVEAAPEDALVPIAADEDLTLAFEGRTASGTLGCETFSARLRMKRDGSLKFRKAVRDDEACVDPVAAEPAGHLDSLLSSVSYRLDDGTLVFIDAEGRDRLRFGPAAPAALVGEWKVRAILGEAGTLLPPTGTTPPTATFTEDGRLLGSTGCDAYSADAAVTGETLAIGAVDAGPAACDEVANAQQEDLLSALASVASWRLTDATLELLDPEARVVLVLAAATPPAAPSPAAPSPAVPSPAASATSSALP